MLKEEQSMGTPLDLIGKPVKYFDYLGSERFGKIIGIEPYVPGLAYIYIEDDEVEFNTHVDFVPYMNTNIKYADMRLSTDVYLDV